MGEAASKIGKTEGKMLTVKSNGTKLISSDIGGLKEAWQKTLRW